MCPCEPENAAPLGAVNPNLRPFQNRTPPFGSRKYQMPIVSRKPKRGIGKGRNIEGITFTGRAGTLCPKVKGQSAEKVLRSCPDIFTHRLDRLGRRSPGIFHGQLSHLTARCTAGMKPEPPFKIADEKFRLRCEHDAEVTECQALLDTTALPFPKRIPPQQKVGVVCFHVCMRICRNVERI